MGEKSNPDFHPPYAGFHPQAVLANVDFVNHLFTEVNR